MFSKMHLFIYASLLACVVNWSIMTTEPDRTIVLGWMIITAIFFIVLLMGRWLLINTFGLQSLLLSNLAPIIKFISALIVWIVLLAVTKNLTFAIDDLFNWHGEDWRRFYILASIPPLFIVFAVVLLRLSFSDEKIANMVQYIHKLISESRQNKMD